MVVLRFELDEFGRVRLLAHRLGPQSRSLTMYLYVASCICRQHSHYDLAYISYIMFYLATVIRSDFLGAITIVGDVAVSLVQQKYLDKAASRGGVAV
ncbi:hypothetical protein DSUL_90006 [Desulfovibrionales bacterium]